MPDENPGDFNEAVMELGAIVCLPTSPLCDICPIAIDCVGYQTGTIHKFPVKTKKVKVKKRYFHYFFIQNEITQEFLIKQRSEKDVWFNLYDFPLVETPTASLAHQPFTKELPAQVYELKHILTHQHLFIKFYKISCSEQKFEQLKNENYVAIDANEIHEIPFPKPIADFLADEFPDMV